MKIKLRFHLVFNPLSPHDASKHHFTYLKIDLILLKPRGLKGKYPSNFYQYMDIFEKFSPTLSHLYPLQDENCDSNSRLVVDEDNNSKFRPLRIHSS